MPKSKCKTRSRGTMRSPRARAPIDDSDCIETLIYLREAGSITLVYQRSVVGRRSAASGSDEAGGRQTVTMILTAGAGDPSIRTGPNAISSLSQAYHGAFERAVKTLVGYSPAR